MRRVRTGHTEVSHLEAGSSKANTHKGDAADFERGRLEPAEQPVEEDRTQNRCGGTWTSAHTTGPCAVRYRRTSHDICGPAALKGLETCRPRWGNDEVGEAHQWSHEAAGKGLWKLGGFSGLPKSSGRRVNGQTCLTWCEREKKVAGPHLPPRERSSDEPRTLLPIHSQSVTFVVNDASCKRGQATGTFRATQLVVFPFVHSQLLKAVTASRPIAHTSPFLRGSQPEASLLLREGRDTREVLRSGEEPRSANMLIEGVPASLILANGSPSNRERR